VEVLHESVVCPGCGCLCDDLDVKVEDGRVVEVANGCTWGVARLFLGHKSHPQKPRFRLQSPFVRRNGSAKDVGLDEALDTAAAILKGAEKVLVYGLGNLSLEAQARGISLAKSLGADIDAPDISLYYHYFEAIKQNGLLWCGLDAVRDRAETVIFWGANPIHSAPRLAARYALFARGRFIPTGFEERTAFTVDIGPTEMDEMSHLIRVERGSDVEAARLIAAASRGDENAQKSLPDGLAKMLDAAKDSEFGCLFIGRGATYGTEPGETISSLVEFAKNTSISAMLLSPDYNTYGLVSLMVEEGLAVVPKSSFIEGPEEYDAVLVAGADPVFFMSEEAKARLDGGAVKIVSLNSFTDYTTRFADAALPSALFGLEEEGHALRMDGALMGLSTLVPARHPSIVDILDRLKEAACA
jgi:formylmethanofuran dehydrogenase subunit B